MKRKLNSIPPGTIERLESNLEDLSFYCNPGRKLDGDAANRLVALLTSRGWAGTSEAGYWPSHELLREIEDDVTALAERGRKGQIYPAWKAFEQVDRRLPKLRLKLRVDNLISRARAMLPPSESQLNKVVRLGIAGEARAQCLYREFVLEPQKLNELLQADRQMERQRCMAKPVAWWTYMVGHPMAIDFACITGFQVSEQDMRDFHRRILQWDRVRRHRLAKKTSSKSVTPV